MKTRDTKGGPVRRMLAATARGALDDDLQAALRGEGLDVVAAPGADALAGLPEVQAATVAGLLVAPALSMTEGPDRWANTAAELTSVFSLVQAYVRNEALREHGRHVVALIPAGAAMGDAQDPATSALAGGMLSLFRTLALEFAKFDMTANCLMVDQVNGRLAGAQEVAAMIRSLVDQRHATISGQQIFAFGARDAGRLRP